MLLDICLGSKSAWRVLLIYGESPGAGFTREDIRRITSIGNKALSMALKRLVAFGVLERSRERLATPVYRLKRESIYSQELLSMLRKERSELNQLPYSFGIIAREFSREALDSADILGMHIFGSVAKGTYRDDSDIDFAVVVEKRIPGHELALNAACSSLSEKFRRKIQCFILEKSQMPGKKGSIGREILKHGIRLA